MANPAQRKLVLASLILALGAGIGAPALAQNPFATGPGEEAPPAPPVSDNPFAAPPGVPAAPMNPFAAEPGAAPAAPEPANPFGAPPAPAPESAFQPQFGQTTTPSANPFDMGSPAPAAPAAPADSNPFAAPAANPFGVTAPPAGGTSPFQFGTTETAEEGRGISQLFQFRFVVRFGRDGRQIVTRQRMTREEAELFDQELKAYFREIVDAGDAPNYQAGVHNPDEWSEWLAYANQVQLWSMYCRDVVLVGTGFEFDPAADIPWPFDVQQARQAAAEEAQGTAGGAGEFGGEREGGAPRQRPQRPADIRNENRSLDDQLADFSIVPDTRQQQGGGNPVIDPAQMNEAIVAIYQQFNSRLRAFEQEQVAFMQDFRRDLEARAQKREAYAEWRQEQKEMIIEYIEEWSRRYEGQVLTIAGVRYELYKPGTEPSQGSRGANIVVTDYDITPYDLLDSTGRLRGPSN